MTSKEQLKQREIECPVCKCHFSGKVMEYDEDGYLQEMICGRCKGTGKILIKTPAKD